MGGSTWLAVQSKIFLSKSNPSCELKLAFELLKFYINNFATWSWADTVVNLQWHETENMLENMVTCMTEL